MSRALWDTGYTITIEAAFSAATGTYGVWDTGLWDTATWGPDIVWSDITADVYAWESQFGRNREVGHYTAATGSVTADNVEGDYTPENLSGAHVTGGITGIRPGRPIRGYVTATDNTRYPLFYGTIDDFDENLNSLSPRVSFVWVDGIAHLVGFDGYEQSAVGSGELAGVRLHRVLDNAEWNQDRNIDVGDVTMQATTLAQDAWSEVLLTADSEGGEVWVDPDGTFRFQDRLSPLRETRSNTVQATFTDDQSVACGLPYEDVTLASGMDILVNEAALARAGGQVTTATDLTSRALYGPRRWGRNDLICETNAQVQLLAETTVARRKDPTRRPRSIVLRPRVFPQLWPVVFDLRLWDRVQVTRHHAAADIEITHDCFVDGVDHSVSAGDWLVTVHLASAVTFPTADEFGVWDTSLWDDAVWGL